MSLAPKACPQCLESFTPKKRRTRYCSRACVAIVHSVTYRRGAQATCAECSAPFYCPPSKKGRMFCSRRCADVAHGSFERTKELIEGIWYVKISKEGARMKVCGCHFHLVADIKWLLGLRGYAAASTDMGNVLFHQLVLPAQPGQIRDHANRDKLDNRCSNLRIITKRENTLNQDFSTRAASGFRGVYPQGGAYYSKIRNFGKDHHLGTRRTPEEAARLYDQKAKELHGEFAILNFPNE